MPNLQNAKKALRQSKKRGAQNLGIKNAYKKAMKAVKKELDANGKDVAEKLRIAQKTLDKAAKRGIIKKNTAARKLSRLAKKTVAKK